MNDHSVGLPRPGNPWPVEDAVAFVASVFEHASVVKEDAIATARILVESEGRGAGSHGLSRVRPYIRRLLDGRMNPQGKCSILRDNGSIIWCDGGNGLGPAIAHHAMHAAIDRATRHSMGLAAVRNGNHFGQALSYSLMAAKAGMIGMTVSNASPRIAPWGGKEALLGNNPWSIAVPCRDRPPIVIDLANSVAAAGKIRQAQARGNTIPLGWGLDADGAETTDPAAALAGSLLPFGGHKGAAITLALGLVTTVLTGGAADWDVRSVDAPQAQHVSHVFLVINPMDVRGGDAYLADASRFAELIARSSPRDGSSPVRLPGERGFRALADAEREGLRLRQSLIDQLRDVAETVAPGGDDDA